MPLRLSKRSSCSTNLSRPSLPNLVVDSLLVVCVDGEAETEIACEAAQEMLAAGTSFQPENSFALCRCLWKGGQNQPPWKQWAHNPTQCFTKIAAASIGSLSPLLFPHDVMLNHKPSPFHKHSICVRRCKLLSTQPLSPDAAQVQTTCQRLEM